MDMFNTFVSHYQQKIGTYDKQLWERSVEKKVLKNIKNVPKKIGRVKSELIDVDLVRGSTFPKAKPQHGWLEITRKGLFRVLFFPFCYKWWIRQTSGWVTLFLSLLYVLQVTTVVICYTEVDHGAKVETLSAAHVVTPIIMMFALGVIHAQIVVTHESHRRSGPKSVLHRRKFDPKPKKVKLPESGPSDKESGLSDRVPQVSHPAEPNGVRQRKLKKISHNRRRSSSQAKEKLIASIPGMGRKENAIPVGRKNGNDADDESDNNAQGEVKVAEDLPCVCRLSPVDSDAETRGPESPVPHSISNNASATSEADLSATSDISDINQVGSLVINNLSNLKGLHSNAKEECVTYNDFNVDSNISRQGTLTYKCCQGDDNVITGNSIETKEMLNQLPQNVVGELIHADDEKLLMNGFECLRPEVDRRDTREESASPEDETADQNGVDTLGGDGHGLADDQNRLLNHVPSCRSDALKRSSSSVGGGRESSAPTLQIPVQMSDPLEHSQISACDKCGRAKVEPNEQFAQEREAGIDGEKLRPLYRYDVKADDVHPGELVGGPSEEDNPQARARRPPPPSLSIQRTPRQDGGVSTGISASSCDVTDEETTTPNTPSQKEPGNSGNLFELALSNRLVTLTQNASPPKAKRESRRQELEDGVTTDIATSEIEWEDTMNTEITSCSSSSHGTSDSELSEQDDDNEGCLHSNTSIQHVASVMKNLASSTDKVTCYIWEGEEVKKVDLTVLDVGWTIIQKVDKIPETCDYLLLGVAFSLLLTGMPALFRLYHHPTTTLGSFHLSCILSYEHLRGAYSLIFGDSWRQLVIVFNGTVQRLFLGLSFFFLLSVAERTYKQRLLYAKHFCYLTSSRRAKKYELPHFRLNKVRNIKTWLSLRSYLKKRGPQRSVDTIVSVSFILAVCLVSVMCIELLQDSESFLDHLGNWELTLWCMALAIYLLRFMTLGTQINKKYRNFSVLITEQINLYLHMEQKPHKKDELMLANNVLKLAEDLLKELESPFKISGLSINPFLYNITKVVLLSAFSAVLTELLGFKLKLYKIKIKA